MSYYRKDGEDIWVLIAEPVVGVGWLVARTIGDPSISGTINPFAPLEARGSDTEAFFTTEALAVTGLGDDWILYNLTSAPAAPTLSSNYITDGASVIITIAADGDIVIYKDNAALGSLTGEVTGTVEYTPPSVGNYTFSLLVSGLESPKSTQLLVSAATAAISPYIISPLSSEGKVVEKNGWILSDIRQSGAYGQIITDAAWGNTDRAAWASAIAYGATDFSWKIDGAEAWSTAALTNIDLGTGMAGEQVEIQVAVWFTDSVPKFLWKIIIQIGN
jgi:hypothetical protein